MISSLLLCCSTSRSGRPIQRHESLRGLLHHVSLSLSLSGSRRVSERLDREADSGSDWTMRRIAGRPKRLGRSQRRRNGKATGAGRTLILAALAWIGGGCCGGGCCGCWSPSAVTPLVNIDTSLSAPFICGCCCCCCCCCCCGTVAIAKAGAGLRALPNVQRPTRRASLVLLVLALLFLVVAVARRRIGSGIEVSPRASRDVLGARPSRRDGRRVAHTHTHTHTDTHGRTSDRFLAHVEAGVRSDAAAFFFISSLSLLFHLPHSNDTAGAGRLCVHDQLRPLTIVGVVPVATGGRFSGRVQADPLTLVEAAEKSRATPSCGRHGNPIRPIGMSKRSVSCSSHTSIWYHVVSGNNRIVDNEYLFFWLNKGDQF